MVAYKRIKKLSYKYKDPITEYITSLYRLADNVNIKEWARRLRKEFKAKYGVNPEDYKKVDKVVLDTNQKK